MIGIGSESGFLSASKCFIGNTNSQDYHSEMNAKHFLEWFQEVLDLVPDKSVLVFDQASYHRTKTEESRNPTTLWRKANVIQWLLNHGVSVPEEYESFHKMTLPVLRQLARLHRVEEIYVIEDMAKKSKKDVKILWLPVAHCELNPIELIWSTIKRKPQLICNFTYWNLNIFSFSFTGNVGLRNKTFKIKDVLQLAQEEMTNVTAESWQGCIKHVVDLEQLFVEKEKIVDDFFEESPPPFQVIIPLGESSTSEESDDESSEDEEQNQATTSSGFPLPSSDDEDQ
jgi:transposase